jgi:hypothetical protein
VTATERPAPRTWRISPDVWLKEVNPLVGETERWETPLIGPHPCRISLAKRSNDIWYANVDSGSGHSVDAWLALAEAQTHAVDWLGYQRSRVDNLDFEFVGSSLRDRLRL